MLGKPNPGGHGGKGGIKIGNDVWVGRRALILPGVTIGDGAVVAAHATVVKNVPPYAIVGGTPAEIIRYRFPNEIIAKMLAIAWWNWDDEKIRQEADALTGPIDDFVGYHFKPTPVQ